MMKLSDALYRDPVGAEEIGCAPFPDAIRERLVSSICGAVPTEMIYIFGSRARGEQHEDSDVDIYVITSDESPDGRAYAAKVRLSLLWLDCGKDVGTVSLASYLDASRGVSHRFLRKEVIERGHLLYRRAAAAGDPTAVRM